ncbi:MAG: DUF2378 family protein [Sandaracinaceae bacterium]
MAPDGFVAPDFSQPLDTDAVLAGIPDGAMMKGMFLEAMVSAAKQAGVTLPSARDAYLGFRSYPLREHCALLIELARGLYPNETLRQGLRRLGRGAAGTMLGSTLGRVTVGAADDAVEVIRQMARTYPLLAQPGHIEVVSARPGRVVVALHDIHFFQDCHHVGVYEGALRVAKVDDPRVLIRPRGDALELACDWRA